MIKTKKQMFTIIGVFTLVMLLGTVSYAFFNYTRTGSANVVRTGQINFSTTQSSGQNGSINLSNVFPIDVTNGVPSNNANVGEVTINVTGSTEYTGGIEYLVTATNVTNTVGSKTVPISIAVTATSGLGTSDDDYFDDVEDDPETSIYKVLAGDTITNNGEILVGYIKPGQAGVNGNVVVKAYLDADKVAITDTYPSGVVRTVKTTNYSSNACETVLDGVTNASTYCATAEDLQDAIDNEDLTSAQIALLVSAGIVEEYTDGTTTEWVDDRVVLTTTEWNGLQSSGVSFKVKVEANEGTWVEDPNPIPTIESCPGCVFYNIGDLSEWEDLVYDYPFDEYDSDGTILTSSDYDLDYRNTITSTRKNFLGLILDEQTGEIQRAFACGIHTNSTTGVETPYCVEGSTDGSKYSSNSLLLQGTTLWNNTCDATSGYSLSCELASTTTSAFINDSGEATTFTGEIWGNGAPYCRVDYDGVIDCSEG